MGTTVSDSCALASDGTAWCLDDLGEESPVAAGHTWTAIASGGDHRCGIKTDDSLWCWGSNDHGELGVGSGGDSATPTLVAGGQTWTEVGAGPDRTCAVRSDATMWCWGVVVREAAGAVSGLAEEFNTPHQMDPATNWSTVDVDDRACGLRADGSAFCWGGDAYLADRVGWVVLGSNSPEQHGTASDWLQVVAGSKFGCGVGAGGHLSCWTLAYDTSFTAPTGIFVAATPRDHHLCGLREDGMVLCAD